MSPFSFLPSPFTYLRRSALPGTDCGPSQSACRRALGATLKQRLGAGPTGARRGTGGLTLLETLVALAILGLLLSLVRPVLDGVGARWRLRAAAQEVEGVVRWAQNAAAARGVPAHVIYDVREGSCWVRLRDKTHAFHALPRGVTFSFVRLGGIEVTGDLANVRAFPDGTLDSHEVALQGAGELRIHMTFERLTGEPSYEETHDDAPR